MKFLITWQLHEGKLHETLGLFTKMTDEKEQSLRGDVTVVTRWHDLVRGTGAMVCDADTAEAVSSYALNWNGFMDFDIAPVVDDEGAREIGRKMDSAT